MKKAIILLLAIGFILALPGIILASDINTAGDEINYEGYTQEEFDALTETTVISSEDSITGYFVKFRYIDDQAKQVRIKGEWNFTDTEHATIYTTAYYTPEDWFLTVYL
ncbi:MAG: hypothetical protein FH762_01445 [Firmicutes bacterium]|nr:hypothetical protein [Bacillota bacterium]